MEKKSSKSLYAYFGELGIFNVNIPGHSFYQVGLLDAIADKYGVDQFDFLNYISDRCTSGSIDPVFPEGLLGDLMVKYTRKLINNYQIDYDEVIKKIQNREYDKLFLKARFRNLSTLQKKFKDAHRFEEIIKIALEAGYSPADIVIIDTDLSLSESFLDKIKELGLSREIPSITMPGMSRDFIDSCMEIHSAIGEDHKPLHMIYYGNLAFDNYKEGHSKNPIITDIIQSVNYVKMFDGSDFLMTVAAKSEPSLETWISQMNSVELIGRENRDQIWARFKKSMISVNVSKDLYITEKFIPARVYESIIFGAIPVSYKWGQHPAMTFETVEDFWEICKFLAECSRKDFLKILRACADSL